MVLVGDDNFCRYFSKRRLQINDLQHYQLTNHWFIILKCSDHRESAGRNIRWKTTRGSSPNSKLSVKILRWLINGMLHSFSSTTPIIYKREVKWSQNQIPLPRQGTVAGRRSAGNETNWLWNPCMGLRSISYISPCVGFDATLILWGFFPGVIIGWSDGK